jgi:hypothetical protein
MELERLINAKEEAHREILERTRASRNPFLYGRHYAGVGIGHKNGDPNRDLCLRYYVRRKLPACDVPRSHWIRTKTPGVMTDVVQTGALIGYGAGAALAAVAQWSAPGSGIRYGFSGVQGPTGTMAAVLVDGQGNRYALTANHVLARNGMPLRRPGFQVVDAGMPGPVIFPGQTIGTAVTFASLGNGGSVDCAMVKADEPGRLRQIFPAQLGKVTDKVVEPAFHQPVRKFGYISSFTEGQVLDQFANIQIDFGVGLGVVQFANAVLIASAGNGTFATQGDSGALVVQQSAGQADGESWDPMGLIVGGTQVDAGPGKTPEPCVFVCPLAQALVQLSAKLAAGAGPLTLAGPD